MRKQRIDAIDVARCIAIFCIVLGHLGNPTIVRIVSTFHVPIFYLISGYFFSPGKTNFREFVLKKVKSLLIPYITTSVLIILTAVIVTCCMAPGEPSTWMEVGSNWTWAALYGAGADDVPRLFRVGPIGAIWFLWASFWGQVLLWLINRLNRKYRIVAVIICISMSMWSRNHIWLPFSIQSGMLAVGFMYAGYVFRENQIFVLSLNNECKILIHICIFLVTGWFMKNSSGFGMVSVYIGGGAISLIRSLCACFAVLQVSFLISIQRNSIIKAMCFFGRNSIVVLSMHLLELNCFPYHLLLNRMIEMQWITEPQRIFVLVFLKFLFIISATCFVVKMNWLHVFFGLKTCKEDNNGKN